MSAFGKVSIVLVMLVAFVAGVLFTTVGANLLGAGDKVVQQLEASTLAADSETASPAPVSPAAYDFETAFTAVAETVNPAVVQVRSETVQTRPRMQNPFDGTPFEEFFRRDGGDQREFRSNALGSGVLISADGYIITNNHVVDEADELEIKLFDDRFFDAKVVGKDPQSDLAVIKIEAQDLPFIGFGEIDGVRVGQWVLAFGSPLSEDLGNTVTAGIVSAIGRTSANLSRLNFFSSFIQTDAAINPGNSGGPLVNLRGRLIGINSAIYSRSGGNQGVGFAIPVDVVKNVSSQLIETGSVERGFLGVGFGPVSETLSKALDVPRGAAQVESVSEGSAAEKAKLVSGDIIVAVDGITLDDFNQLPKMIGNKRPGDVVVLDIVREGERLEKRVKLGRRDDAAIAENMGLGSDEESRGMGSMGFSVRDVTTNMLQQLGIDDEDIEGVLISEIDESSAAYRDADLRQGDIVTEVNKQRVRSRKDFIDAFDRIKSGQSFIVRVVRVRQGQIRTFFTALEKAA